MNKIKRIGLITLFFLGIITDIKAQNDSTKYLTIDLEAVEVIASSKELSKMESLPVSSTVLSGHKLNTENITLTNDLTARIPNLYMPEYGSKLTSPVYIRGIGSRVNSPSVGLYVNDIPYFEKGMYRIDFDNVKRVEVLRGPQGTLYGRNTMGGVINIHTFSPFDWQGTKIKLSGGMHNDFATTATFQQIFAKKWGLTLSAGYKYDGGDFKNITSNEYTGKLNDTRTSLSLEYRPNNLWKFAYAGTFLDSKQNGYPYAPIDVMSNKVEDIVYNQASGYDQALTTHALNIKREDKSTLLTSVTAFQWLGDKQCMDQDFIADSTYFATQKQKQLMLSQEFVLRSNRKNTKYQWLFGAFGFLQQTESKIDVDSYVQKAAEYRTTDIETWGAALFHQSRLNDIVIKNLSAEVGLRMDVEKSGMDYDYSLGVGNTITSSPRISSNLDFVKFIPRVSVLYTYSDHLWFASFSYGYKTGGFNNAFELDTDRSFDPENSLNYEIGYRSGKIANRFNLDFSFFYIDWENQQIYATNPSGRGSVLRNAGKSHSTGIEASIYIDVIKNLSLNVEYGYTYAVFDDNKKNDKENYSGNYIPYVPRRTLSATAFYNIYLNKYINRINLMAQYKGIGKLFWDETNGSEQDYYGVFNLQAEFIVNSMFKFSLWGKNVFDVNYNVFDFKVGLTRFGQQGMPRAFGIGINVFI